jgi:hypothetical protein
VQRQSLWWSTTSQMEMWNSPIRERQGDFEYPGVPADRGQSNGADIGNSDLWRVAFGRNIPS